MSASFLFNMLSSTGVFLLVISLWLMALVVWASRKGGRSRLMQQRLGLSREGRDNGRTLRLWLDGREVETAVGGDAHVDLATRFATMCRDAGWQTAPGAIFLAAMGVICVAFVCGLALVGNFVVAAGIASLVATIFWLYLQHRIHRRRELFENQLIDALELAARSLRVGHPLVGAMRLVSEEIAAPIGPMFAAIVQQQELGVSMDEAIRTTAEASSSDDLKLFATAVVIQLNSGGNLADMMERVASVMRDRLRLGRRVRVLIAQSQFSKQVLLALPVVMFVLLNWMNPDYMRPLYITDGGRVILAVALAMVIVGSIVMNRLANIRY